MSNPELLTGLGIAFAMFFSTIGASKATAHAGMFVLRSKDYKSFGPIIIAGVLALYGLIISGILALKLTKNGTTTSLSEKDGYVNLAAGLAVGLSCLASGLGMSKFIEQSLLGSVSNTTAVTTGSMEQALLPQATRNNTAAIAPEFTVRYCFVMIYLEAIGLYGLIIALFLTTSQ